MSYLVLARKWRPGNFADVVGQTHVLQVLTNAFDSGRLHHAYLFAGTRGVGKTTLARIVAKALNCERGVSATPCGECSACVEIDDGRFVDLIEVDAASRTRVDDTRELLDNVQYAPARGRYKVYLIDEVHMLSAHSFNALLKTLEEPPPHVKFLFATTDPQKLPVTVLSRCLQFNLKRLAPQLIAERLAKICAAEEVEAEPESLALIARSAEGSMRDALSLLDQAIAFGGGRLPASEVRSMLGTIDRRHVAALLDALAAEEGAKLLDIVAELDEQAPDYSQLFDELAATLQRIAVQQVVGDNDAADPENEALIERLAEALSPEDVQLFYQTALLGRRDLNLAPDPRAGFEMTLLRMLAFRPQAAGETAPQAGAGSRTANAQPAGGREASRARGKATARSTGEATRPSGRDSAASASRQGATTATSPPGERRVAGHDTSRAAEPRAEGPEDASGAGGPRQTDVEPPVAAWDDPDWHRLVADLPVEGMVKLLAANCSLTRRDGATVRLALDARSEALLTEQRASALAEALSGHFGEKLRVTVAVVGNGGHGDAAETPAQREARLGDEKIAAAREALERDPNVQTMKTMFGAELDPDSVRPAESGDGHP